ncbi:MAG: hypothetical protein GY729_15440 [Desulfobacteraceae bacterium]|nr:hypothetical protein [Desulfobacteraceae bacterium]
MKNSNFQIQMQCPQCGAPVILDETQVIVQCEFCRTRNIIHTHPFPCYYMEPRQEQFNKLPVVYAPFWRFKGLEFSLGLKSPGYRIIDHSLLAVDTKGLPVSLGLRSQTQTLKFIKNGIPGSFLAPSISRNQMLKMISGSNGLKVHIGEILSLIFFPFYQDKEVLYDGLSGQILNVHPDDLVPDKKPMANPLEFTPSLCPNCGWDLLGETDSMVLYCLNCTSFWLIRNKKINKLEAKYFDSQAAADIFLPFWQMQVEFKTLKLYSYAQFMQIANLPKVPQASHESQIFYFFIPAFKITPKLFLRVGRQITAAQINTNEILKMPKTKFHPADLPLEEGFQAVFPFTKEIYANKLEITDILPLEKIKLKSYNIAYVPFRSLGNEYIQDELNISVQKNSLRFGRDL